MSTCESGEWALATGARLAESGGGGGPSGLRNIVLTGFMGSGKTTVGSILADRLGREFIDTDAVIESSSGPIAGIVAASGWPAFRAMEREVASELAGRSGLVIATGGRLMLDAECAACLEPGADVVWLQADPAEIIDRVVTAPGADPSTRPLLTAGGADPREAVARSLERRAALYRRYPAVDTTGLAPEEAAEGVLVLLGLQRA